MSPIRMSRLESAIRVVLKWRQAFNRQDVAGMVQLMSEDCVFESAGPAPDGAVYAGVEAITRYWQEFFGAAPQAHLEVEDTFSAGMRCVLRGRYEWVDAAGEKRAVRSVDLFQVRDGVICEMSSYVKG